MVFLCFKWFFYILVMIYFVRYLMLYSVMMRLRKLEEGFLRVVRKEVLVIKLLIIFCEVLGLKLVV